MEHINESSLSDIDSQLGILLERGTRESFRESPMPNAMSLWIVLWRNRGHMLGYYRRLPHEDQFSFIKSIAALEVQVGGRGSVSLLIYLLGTPQQADRQILDWVLAYTPYARSLFEFDFWTDPTDTTRSRRQKQFEMEMCHKAESARKATERIFGAVRRKDRKAVAALIARGADPEARASDGRALIEIALAIGDENVVSQLREAIVRINDET